MWSWTTLPYHTLPTLPTLPTLWIAKVEEMVTGVLTVLVRLF